MIRFFFLSYFWWVVAVVWLKRFENDLIYKKGALQKGVGTTDLIYLLMSFLFLILLPLFLSWVVT